MTKERAMMAEERATVVEIVARVVREEATQAVVWYKTSIMFEDEVNEAVCNAYYKGFEECKRKVA